MFFVPEKMPKKWQFIYLRYLFIYLFIYPLFYIDNYRIQLYTIKIAKIC